MEVGLAVAGGVDRGIYALGQVLHLLCEPVVGAVEVFKTSGNDLTRDAEEFA